MIQKYALLINLLGRGKNRSHKIPNNKSQMSNPNDIDSNLQTA